MPRRPRPIRPLPLPGPPVVPSGRAAAMEAALEHEVVRQLGAVPLLLPIVEQVGLRAVINQRVHPNAQQAGDLDLGLVTEVLVLNRLLAPRPLVHVETWLGGTVVPELLGLEAEQCNDDRLARALDELSPHLDELWQDLVVAAVRSYRPDLSRLGYDITSISFCGAYEQADLVTYGYSRDHRPDRQQLEVATNSTISGGIPIDYRILAGNVADRTTPVENLRRLQRLRAALPAPDRARPWLVVSDRAMLTLEAIAAYRQSGLHCLGPLDPSVGHGAVRRLLESVTADELAASPLGYRPQRAAADPDWEPYQGVLRMLELPHPEARKPPLQIQALVVWSPGHAHLDAQRRATLLGRLEAKLRDLASKLGRRPYLTSAAVEKRVTALLAHHPARRFLSVTVGTTEHGPTLNWQRQEAELAAAAALDGRYVAGTTALDLDATTMLTHAKGRDVPEKGYARLKGPLAIRPVYLHKQERILALIFCTMVALLVFSLLELLVRRAGLTVSGPALLAQFAPLAILTLVFNDHSQLRRLTGLAPPIRAVLEVLGWADLQRYTAVSA